MSNLVKLGIAGLAIWYAAMPVQRTMNYDMAKGERTASHPTVLVKSGWFPTPLPGIFGKPEAEFVKYSPTGHFDKVEKGNITCTFSGDGVRVAQYVGPTVPVESVRYFNKVPAAKNGIDGFVYDNGMSARDVYHFCRGSIMMTGLKTPTYPFNKALPHPKH